MNMLTRSWKKIGIHKDVATKIKDILDFTEEQKDFSIEALVNSFHKQSDAQQKIKDALNEFGIEVIIIDDDGAPVDVIRNYMQDRQKQDREVLAYVRLYIDDTEQNTSWLKYDFPCPVVFDFYKTKAKDQATNDSAIVKACNEEFSLRGATVHQRILKINSHLEGYSSYLQELVSICSNKDDIYRCVVESFDENATEGKLFSFARSVRLNDDPYNPCLLRDSSEVDKYKTQLVHEITKKFCENISGSILEKLSKHIKNEINMKAFDAVRAYVASSHAGNLASGRIFVWIYELLLNTIRRVFLAVFIFLIPRDINSNSWRREIVKATHENLLGHRSDILKELHEQYQETYEGITDHLKRELQKTSDHHLLPYSAKGRSGMTDSWSYHHESEQPVSQMDYSFLDHCPSKEPETIQANIDLIEKYKHRFSPELHVRHCDVMVVYSEIDRDAAEEFRQSIDGRILRLENGEEVEAKAMLYDMEGFGNSEFIALEAAYNKSTYAFLYLTKSFVENDYDTLVAESLLMDTINDKEKQWRVVPIHTSPFEKRQYKVPLGINTLKVFNAWKSDEFYWQCMDKFLAGRIFERKNREIKMFERQYEEALRIQREDKKQEDLTLMTDQYKELNLNLALQKKQDRPCATVQPMEKPMEQTSAVPYDLSQGMTDSWSYHHESEQPERKRGEVIQSRVSLHVQDPPEGTPHDPKRPESSDFEGMTDSWSYHHESEQPGITDHLKRELQKTSDHHLLPYSAKGRSGMTDCRSYHHKSEQPGDVRAVDAKVDAVEDGVRAVNDKIGAVEDGVRAINTKVDAVEDGVRAVNAKVDAVEDACVRAVNVKVGAVEDKVGAVEDGVRAVNDKVGAVEDGVRAVNTKVDAVEDGVKAVKQQLNAMSGDKVFVGCKLTAATYGTDEFGRKVIGLRSDNFDHIHVSYEMGMDIFFDKKTIKESTSELQQVDTYLDFQQKTVEIEITLRGHLKQIIRKHTPDLIKTHSNLITISTSPVMSHRDGIEKAPCIVIYCSCKGIIPLGEHKFPRTLDKIPVDVREGYVYFATAREFHDPLRQGCSIGVSGDSKAGSIGVFVKEIDTADQYGLLTCAHVLLPSTELNKPGIRQKIRDSIVTVDVVQPSYLDNNSNIRCGRLIDANFGNVSYQNKFTGVDYAYVKMTSRIPRVLKFPSVEWQHTEASLRDGYTEEAEMGPPILDMDENDTEHCVCKFGRTTGHTRGVFNFNGAVLRKEPFSASLGQQANEECCLYNLYNIESVRRPFFDQGDSGASVFIRKKNDDEKTKVHVIGLALGGLCNGRECFVTPIGAVLDSIDPRIEIQCFPY